VVTPAREDILGRIRAIDRGRFQPYAREYRRETGRQRDEVTELFCTRVGDYHATVDRVRTNAIGDRVAAALRERSAQRIGVPPGLPEAWRPAGFELVEDHGLTPVDLDGLNGVITGCTVAIAETGTIVLTGAAAEGRRVLTLVPDLHLCVVRERQIVGIVPEAIAAVSDLVHEERRPLTFISGPSATSDIELSRVEGVHGPRNLVVLVVSEGAR
jgi:L-lactate dehydrogenase complex protein LldG